MTIDKHILITGANGGIGFEVARLLAEQKANLTLLYHENQQQLENFSTPGQQLEIKKVDLANEKELNNTITSILQNHPIDIFIHSPAYPIQHRDIMNTTWNDFQKQIDLQTKSFLQISKLIIPQMKSQKFGKIISILTSYVVGKPPNGIPDYVVGKYSLLGLTKCMAGELGPFGIRANSVSPSMVNTPLTDPLPEKLKEITKSQIPLEGRLAEPVEVAGTVLFLCTDNSNYITGENILVTGGHTMH
ncbi:3-oxoacyl-acyl-carrier-protein reductase FabG [Marine Group I thaumarchaeote SCGC AAA799-D07]|nr:3-oxoacyl-acyl-carrier-protein reductase FabG [Marine Group I thaumarchaeote SCGC AAA799-D07]